VLASIRARIRLSATTTTLLACTRVAEKVQVTVLDAPGFNGLWQVNGIRRTAKKMENFSTHKQAQTRE